MPLHAERRTLADSNGRFGTKRIFPICDQLLPKSHLAELRARLVGESLLARPIHKATASCCSDGDVAVPD